MRYSVPATAEQVRETRDWSHKGMLNGAFPALDGNHVGHTLEGYAEVRPDRCSNQEVEDQVAGIDLDTGDKLRACPNIGHAHGIYDVIDQPDQFPGPVTLGQVPVAFEKGVGRTP